MSTSKKRPATQTALCLVALLGLGACASRLPLPEMPPLQAAAAHAVQKDPRNPELWIEYGRAALFSGNPSGAEAAFLHALVLDRKFLPAEKHLGMVLNQTQRPKDAQVVYEQALRVADGDSELLTGYGFSLAANGDEQGALNAFQKAVSAKSDVAAVVSARLGAAGLLLRRGDNAAAQHEYDEALKLSPDVAQMLEEQRRN